MFRETSNSQSMDQQKNKERFFLPLSASENYDYCNVIGPKSVQGMTACPCCNRSLGEKQETLDEPLKTFSNGSLFTDDDSFDESCDDLDEQNYMMPGVLAEGIAYTVKTLLVQGWVHKKGTGMDWIGSRAWKPRWAVLAVSSKLHHK